MHNPYVQSLNLEGCKNLTDAVLHIFPERFENLQELNLKGFKQTTEAGLYLIAENASKLKYLTLDHCPGTTIKILTTSNVAASSSKCGACPTPGMIFKHALGKRVQAFWAIST